VTKRLVEETINEILNNFSLGKFMTCPICRAIMDLTSQKLDSDSNFYFCANCGFTIAREMK
jgi:predicted RNA-binding Zn-ribbon protein involved in translation (DUF1610 family)